MDIRTRGWCQQHIKTRIIIARQIYFSETSLTKNSQLNLSLTYWKVTLIIWRGKIWFSENKWWCVRTLSTRNIKSKFEQKTKLRIKSIKTTWIYKTPLFNWLKEGNISDNQKTKPWHPMCDWQLYQNWTNKILLPKIQNQKIVSWSGKSLFKTRFLKTL